MPKPRTCEHCDTVIPVDRGFHFDKYLNLICGVCGGIVCPTEDEIILVDDNYKRREYAYGIYD